MAPAPLQIVIDMNRPDYLESKAVELIYQAQHAILISEPIEEYHNKITMAITLLAVARGQRNIISGPPKVKSQKRARSRNTGGHNPIPEGS